MAGVISFLKGAIEASTVALKDEGTSSKGAFLQSWIPQLLSATAPHPAIKGTVVTAVVIPKSRKTCLRSIIVVGLNGGSGCLGISTLSDIRGKYSKNEAKCQTMGLAGVEGIEPPVAVLETAGLPLTDTPRFKCYLSVQALYLASDSFAIHISSFAIILI